MRQAGWDAQQILVSTPGRRLSLELAETELRLLHHVALERNAQHVLLMQADLQRRKWAK